MSRVADPNPPPPPPTTEPYARARGLGWAQEARSMPFGCLFDHRDGRNLNVMSGTMGGQHGLLAHRILSDQRTQLRPAKKWTVYEAHTVAAVMAPETKATLRVAMYTDAFIDPDEAQGLAYGRVGYTEGTLAPDTDWRVITLHPDDFDVSLVQSVWAGPVGDWMRANGRQSILDIRAGVLSYWRPGHFVDAENLDHQSETVVDLAAMVRAQCRPHTTPSRFDAVLPEPPAWGDPSRKPPDHLGRAVDRRSKGMVRSRSAVRDLLDPGATAERGMEHVRDFAHGYARQRGLALEDPRTFELSFPSLPFGGWAQIVWRGALPGARPYRLVVTAMLHYVVSRDKVYGAVAAVAPASAVSAEAPLRWDPDNRHFKAVVDGLLVVWRPHKQMNVDHDLLDDVVGRLQRSI